MTLDLTDRDTWTDDDLNKLRIAVLTEQETRALLANAPSQIEALASRVEQHNQDQPPTPWDELVMVDRVAPGQRVIWTDGNIWRNASRAYLPITATPATYPLGWTQETGLPDEIDVWAPGVAYAADKLLDFEGTIYRVIQAHTSQAGWLPPNVPALYAPQG